GIPGPICQRSRRICKVVQHVLPDPAMENGLEHRSFLYTGGLSRRSASRAAIGSQRAGGDIRCTDGRVLPQHVLFIEQINNVQKRFKGESIVASELVTMTYSKIGFGEHRGSSEITATV